MDSIKVKNPKQGLKHFRATYLNIRTMPHSTLYDLRGYHSARCELYDKTCFGLTMFALSSPTWFFVAVVMGLSGATKLATIFMWFVPFSLLLSLTGWLYIYFVEFSEIGEEKRQLDSIKRELFRRKRDDFSFASDN